MEAVNPPPRGVALSFQKPADSSQALSQLLYNLTIMGANDIRTYDSLEIAKKESRPLRLLTQIEVMLGRLTGKTVSFKPVPTPTTTLIVRWGNSKALPFNLLPDGLRSVLGWLVELAVMMDIHYPGDQEPWRRPLIVLLDEVERHLHPAWQRQVLPIAQEMFPNAQFFVATHSPFIIASLNEGWIHHLNLTEEGKATIDPPIPASEGDSYVSVMGSIMGVTELYDPETEELLQNYRELRTKALEHEPGALEQALSLAEKTGQRSVELGYMMTKETAQLKRMTSEAAASK
jgi:predicted ATP-binding protein involved in virulence